MFLTVLSFSVYLRNCLKWIRPYNWIYQFIRLFGHPALTHSNDTLICSEIAQCDFTHLQSRDEWKDTLDEEKNKHKTNIQGKCHALIMLDNATSIMFNCIQFWTNALPKLSIQCDLSQIRKEIYDKYELTWSLTLHFLSHAR